MNYADGTKVQVGDVIQLGPTRTGTVLVLIEENLAVPGYDPEPWLYLGDGVVIDTDFGELRLEQMDADTLLQSRAQSKE